MPETTEEKTEEKKLVGAAALVAALVSGLIVALVPSADGRHVEGVWDESMPDGSVPTECWVGLARAPEKKMQELFPKLDPTPKTAFIKVCYVGQPGLDAGLDIDAGPRLQKGPPPMRASPPLPLEFTLADGAFRPYLSKEPTFEAWVVDHEEAPARCACGATVADAGRCEKLVKADGSEIWMPADPNADMNLAIGRWRGGCARMPCVTWGGNTQYIPSACCADECKGKQRGVGRCGSECLGEARASDDADEPAAVAEVRLGSLEAAKADRDAKKEAKKSKDAGKDAKAGDDVK